MAQFSPESARSRLTYVMLGRVATATLLLGAALVSELGAHTEEARAPVVGQLSLFIVATYALTIAFALVLRRAKNIGGLAIAQVASDLLFTAALVHSTGGAESAFLFLYILVIVGAAFVLGRGATVAAAAAIVLYVVDGLIVGGEPLRPLIRSLATNAVAFGAAGGFAMLLVGELRRQGEHIQTQRAALSNLAALHEDIVRSLPSGLMTVDPAEHVLTVNNAAALILARPLGDIIGKRLDELMPNLAALAAGAGDDGVLRRCEVTETVTANGRLEPRRLGASLSPLVDSTGRAVGRVVNFQDLTELRRIEQYAKRTERLAAIGRLAAGIAHEIRNPLAAISGSIELLAQPQPAADAAGPAKMSGENQELMSIVIREVERLNALVTGLLEFARPRERQLQPLDVGVTMSELLRVWQNDKQLGGSAVELSADPGVVIEADAAELRQVLWNLLRNAAEAAPGQPIRVLVKREAESALIAVADRGPGIAPEHRARLFEPFFSTKERGTGLGLATIHRIVEDHKGTIDVDCPPDGGTTMTVRLPLDRTP